MWKSCVEKQTGPAEIPLRQELILSEMMSAKHSSLATVHFQPLRGAKQNLGHWSLSLQYFWHFLFLCHIPHCFVSIFMEKTFHDKLRWVQCGEYAYTEITVFTRQWQQRNLWSPSQWAWWFCEEWHYSRKTLCTSTFPFSPYDILYVIKLYFIVNVYIDAIKFLP